MRALVLSFGMVSGPAVAGVLVATLGPGGAIAIDAATFAASAVALSRLRPEVVERAAAAAPAFLDELREGFAEIRQRAWVRGFLVVLFVYSVVVLPSIFVLGPVLAEEELGGVGAWAVITAAFGIGSIAGDLLILRCKPARPLLWSALGFTVASSQALIIGSGLPVGAIAGLEALTGVAVSAGFGLWETTLQEQIPEHAISRVSSVDHLVSIGLMPIGLTLAGPVAEVIGLHETLLLETAIGLPVAACLLLVPGVRTIRRGRVGARGRRPGARLALRGPDAVELHGGVDALELALADEGPVEAAGVPERLAGRVVGHDGARAGDPRDPAREVHGPPEPVARPGDRGPRGDADPQLREVLALRLRGGQERVGGRDDGRGVRRDEQHGVPDALDEAHGRLDDLGGELPEPLRDPLELVGRELLAQAGEADEVREGHGDLPRAGQRARLALVRGDDLLAHGVVQVDAEHLLHERARQGDEAVGHRRRRPARAASPRPPGRSPSP